MRVVEQHTVTLLLGYSLLSVCNLSVCVLVTCFTSALGRDNRGGMALTLPVACACLFDMSIWLGAGTVSDTLP